jgi:hypothetical protein
MAMTDDRQRQQRAKNRALLAVLAGLALLFYLMALVKMGAF